MEGGSSGVSSGSEGGDLGALFAPALRSDINYCLRRSWRREETGLHWAFLRRHCPGGVLEWCCVYLRGSDGLGEKMVQGERTVLVLRKVG
jgi:hypothetical protein